MEREQKRYSRLANLTKLINSKLELREVLQHVTTAISEEIVQCDAVGIFLPKGDGTFRGYAGKPDHFDGITLDTQIIDPRVDRLAREVIETNRPIYIADTSKDDRPDKASVAAFHIQSMLAMPISFEQELFGLVFLFDYGIPMNLTLSEIERVEAYVNMAAVAIRNAQNVAKLEDLIEERTKELEAANEKKDHLMETIPDGFVLLDKDWVYTYVNQHQYLPLNKTPEEVLGKNIWGEFPHLVDTLLYKEFHQVMATRIPVHFDSGTPYSDFWYEVFVYPYGDGICCLTKDITEKRNYEKELKRLSGLELIGQMAAGISHEVRNPMTTVRGLLQMLGGEGEFTKYQPYFNLMVEELDRANSIITEFLSMSNTRSTDLQPLDLNSIIMDMVPLIKVDALNQNKHIEFDQNSIPELLLNRNEIRQLIINLYRNGLEAMESGKVLTIRTFKENHYVVLAVQDEGEGIKPEVLDKIGTPFFTTKEKGTGLGLGVSYAIAARHHAKIDIKTGPGGTTFFVRFRMEKAPR